MTITHRILPFFLCLQLLVFVSCSRKIVPEKPVLSKTAFMSDTLQLSEIDIPLQINLRPFYAMAEKNVKTIYASPGWPNDFVVDNCDTKYMYRFKRGPFKISSQGSSVNLGFTGSYIIAGAQRICTGTGSNRVAVTPWSPACTCGLNEGERKVEVGYNAFIRLKDNYDMQVIMKASDPRPVDKCTLCFWGEDITDLVMRQLKQELDLAGKEIQDSINRLNLRPQFQQLWNMLHANISVYDIGYLKINPEKIRLSSIYARNDTLNISLGISARPRISLHKTEEIKTLVPNISDFSQRSGFSIYTDAVMNYDSLSRILNRQLCKKRIDMEQVGKHIIVEQCEMYGVGSEKLVFKLKFSGSATGELYLTGKPEYEKETERLVIKNLDYDLHTRNMLIKTARWLFNRRIIHELNRYAVFNLSEYAQHLLGTLNEQLNRYWDNGVYTSGLVNKLQVVNIYSGEESLAVRFYARGDLSIRIDSFEGFSF